MREAVGDPPQASQRTRQATTRIPSTGVTAPSPAVTRTTPKSGSWRESLGWESRPVSAEVEMLPREAEEWAFRLQDATDILLDKLFAYLAKLPEEGSNCTTRTSDPGGGGMTLPASAIGWLSSQLYPPIIDYDIGIDNQEYADESDLPVSPNVWLTVAVKDRLRLLRFLLPRVTHLRITRQVWPPQRPKTKQRRSRPQPPTPGPPEELDLNVSLMSVSSGLTTDENVLHSTGLRGGPPTRVAFSKYIHGLQANPTINLRLFPNLRVLVLESIPPTWIHNLRSLQFSLQALKWNRSCLYNYLPSLFLQTPTESSVLLNSPARWKTHPDLQQSQQLQQDPLFLSKQDSPLSSTLPAPAETSSGLHYTQLTHLSFNHCNLGESSGLSKILSKCVPQLEGLHLAHNEFVSQKAALKGLQHANRLSKLNLSYNQISCLPKAYFYLGGQLQRLQLSHNHLVTISGIDHLYALEELYLDNNRLASLSDVAGLCQLPQLHILTLQNNPLEKESPKYYRQIWKWFQQAHKVGIPEELPMIDGRKINSGRWEQIQREEVATSSVQWLVSEEKSAEPGIQEREATQILPARYPRVKRRFKRSRSPATIDGPWRLQTNHWKLAGKTESFSAPTKFSVRDVLASLHTEVLEEIERSPEARDDKKDALMSVENEKPGEALNEFDGEQRVYSSNTTNGIVDYADYDGDVEEFAQYTHNNVQGTPSNEKSNSSIHDAEASSHEERKESSGEINPTVISGRTAMVPKLPDAEDLYPNVTVRPRSRKIATIKLQPAGTFIRHSIMDADWDEVIRMSAEDLIPDGKPRMPTVSLATPTANGGGFFDTFSPEATDLLEQEDSMKKDNGGFLPNSASEDSDHDESRMSSVDHKSNPLPEQIYSDDCSLPSSLGTNREDFSNRLNKLQIAESNAAFDGPQQWADMKVLENLELYFDSYIFTKSIPAPEDNDIRREPESGETVDWQKTTLQLPRIQLMPEDRRLAETSLLKLSSELGNWTNPREHFVRVWEEDILPCGKDALRRLLPYRRPRLGFHGDELYEGGSPDMYAESRKVYLCLSSAALYVVIREDSVTKKWQNKGSKKSFPRPIPKSSTFENALWPHAVARHVFQDLEMIIIGFEFQRITLRFSNPTGRKADPFIYVLLTSNKAETVKILQDIQRLYKESKKDAIELTPDTIDIAIENDSQEVMDALQQTIQPEPVGIVMHYQIVQQRWKHGEGRGTVRRTCVVTDTKVFLLDEDYELDGHKPLERTTTRRRPKEHLSRVSYRLVDAANLSQVGEVQAAGADPKSITIVVHPLSRLSRTHRWRLVCRDRVGAERLVEDVRKAIKMLS